MWRPISSVNGRLAVPLKSLKRLSSLRLRVRLRSGAGLASLALAAGSRGTPFSGSLGAPSRGSFGPLPGCLSSNVTVNSSTSISAHLQAGWLWLLPGVPDLKNLAGRLGFEPRQVPPKGTVLPLDDRPTVQPNVSLSRRTVDCQCASFISISLQ